MPISVKSRMRNSLYNVSFVIYFKSYQIFQPYIYIIFADNVGLGGAVVVALYRLGFPNAQPAPTSGPKLPGGNSKIKSTPDGFLGK